MTLRVGSPRQSSPLHCGKPLTTRGRLQKSWYWQEATASRVLLSSGRHGSKLERCKAHTQTAQQVLVEVDKGGRNVRILYAGIDIDAPVAVVWQALTDYEGLGNFIPGLAENKCLERRAQGAKLLQIGQQEIALGAIFKATVILDIQEYLNGVPENLCCSPSGKAGRERVSPSKSLFPEPRSNPSDGSPQDIAFSMLEGDFLAFRGIWRMQATPRECTRLSYSLHVQPKSWLPVRLIQNRITGEIKVNLNAVRQHSENLFLAARKQ